MVQIPESRADKFHRLNARLQKTSMLIMAFMVALTFLTANLQALLWQSSSWLVGAVLPGVVATLTNEERGKYQVAPLSRSAILDAAANMKAEHMAAEEYFSHDSPGGITPWYWFEQAGYVYAHAGENLAIHFQDSDEVVKAWMNSPAHKANVVGPQYTEIGIGTAKGSYKGHPTVYVVQLFGAPAKRPVVIPPLVVVQVEAVETPADSLALADSGVLVADQTDDVLGTTDSETRQDSPVVLVEGEQITADEEVVAVENNLAVDTFVSTETIITPTSFIATSSGLEIYHDGSEFVAGTSAAILSTLATKPRSVLQGMYLLIGGLVMSLLIISVVLGYRYNHRRSIVTGVGLLLLMSLLFVWHIAITGGAVVV